MEESKNTCSGTPNPPRGACVDSKALDAMPAVELAEELERVWGEMDEDTYDESVISAYLDALDRKVPLPDHPDAQTAYRRFSELTGKQCRKSGRGASSGILRAAIAAVVTLAVVFGAMITAQAAGLDVFGRIARWTKETFSFGENNVLDTDDAPKGNGGRAVSDVAKYKNGELSEFQKALDDHGIVSVKEPTWLPDGYVLAKVSVMDLGDFGTFMISANFADSKNSCSDIIVYIEDGNGTSAPQIQKEDELIEKYNLNGKELYIVYNENNYTVSWFDSTCEYQLLGENKGQLKLVAESMMV